MARIPLALLLFEPSGLEDRDRLVGDSEPPRGLLMVRDDVTLRCPERPFFSLEETGVQNTQAYGQGGD